MNTAECLPVIINTLSEVQMMVAYLVSLVNELNQNHYTNRNGLVANHVPVTKINQMPSKDTNQSQIAMAATTPATSELTINSNQNEQSIISILKKYISNQISYDSMTNAAGINTPNNQIDDLTMSTFASKSQYLFQKK